MINYFLKIKTKNVTSNQPSISNIKDSKKILFAIFTRYGDTIIDLVVIKEFIELYPRKDYLILCPKQMKPYISELLPNTKCISINKRNFFELYMVNKLLNKIEFDIGFSPWSSGLDSLYFLSFCNQFLFYKDFKRPKLINHYEVVRNYLRIPKKDWKIQKLTLKKNYKKILICPQSTSPDRSLTHEQLDNLLQSLKIEYEQSVITIASTDKSFFRKGYDNFIFYKTAESSQKFLALMKNNTLIVTSDSGPLHIALALKKDTLALMRSTNAEMVINTGSNICIRNM